MSILVPLLVAAITDTPASIAEMYITLTAVIKQGTISMYIIFQSIIAALLIGGPFFYYLLFML
jgi:hypothetical protein